MSLLPSKPDASPSEDAGPRVVGVDSEDAEAVLSALSSETARNILAAVHDDPAPPSELAERVDTSLQNAQYHLENLEDAGAVEVVDTAYSAKGREMDVYAAADQPLVIFAGDQEDSSVLRTAIQRLVGALGVLALASLAVQALFGREFGTLAPTGQGGGDAGGEAAGGADGDGRCKPGTRPRRLLPNRRAARPPRRRVRPRRRHNRPGPRRPRRRRHPSRPRPQRRPRRSRR
ncbi:MAG: ArsR family transcriptional regulator [Halobacteriales archaeon SW_9_67_25]|nr:MAG: ArsR family transcriptional regulator [Halobacteriales archaeon SW_9_67_25]